MKETINNIELKVYNFLGIKKFRKLAFAFADFIVMNLLVEIPKENRKYYMYHNRSNYHLGRVNDLDDIKSFKKMLYINAGIHLLLLNNSIFNF